MKSCLKISLLFVLLVNFPIYIYSQEGYQIGSIKFEGNKHLSANSLKKYMELETKTVTNRIFWWKEWPVFHQEELNDDLIRIRQFYQTNGYLYAQVNARTETDKEKYRLKLIILITENQPVLFDGYTIGVQSPEKEKVDSIIKLSKKKIKFKNGTVFMDEDVNNVVNTLYLGLINNGFPFPKVDPEVSVDTVEHKAKVNFAVRSNNFSHLGEIRIEGLEDSDEGLVSKRMNLKSGSIYSKKDINTARSNAFNTNLFQYVVVNPDVSSDTGNIVPLIVSVEESKRWDFRIGAGYSTDDRFRVSLLFTKRAFLGGDRTLEYGIKHSYTWPIDTYLKFTQPGFLMRGVDFIFNPYYSIDREVDYRVERLGSNFTFDKDFGRKHSAYFAYTLEQSKLTSSLDTTRDENDPVSWDYISGFSVGYQFKSVNSTFDPKKGWVLYVTNGLSGLFFDKAANYYKIAADLRRYQPLNNEFVLALRAKIGYMVPMEPDETTPIQERFLLGGSNSIRGYGRNTIGYLNEEGVTIGGNSMMEGSIELRYPIYKSFRGVVFMDTGNTWEDSGYYSFKDLKYSVGLGLRYSTPIGPIRLDMATPVINDPFSFHFYITIGQAF